MANKPVSNKKWSIGFTFAFKGIYVFFRDGRNAKIHLIAAVLVVTLGLILELTPQEWLWIALCIALVFCAEMINTSIELLCDLVMPDKNEKAGRLKDIAAGSVLVLAIFSLIVFVLIFWRFIS